MEMFEVLADPTRRRIVEMLADGDRIAGELAREFSLSQPAVSKHLRVLREAGAVSSRPQGQQRVYRLESTALDAIAEWVQARRRAWERRLDALDRHMDSRRSARKKRAR